MIVILPGQYIYIDNFCKNIVSAIGALERIISYIPMSTAVQVYHALIQPHFDYCCSVWDGLGETLSTKLVYPQGSECCLGIACSQIFK